MPTSIRRAESGGQESNLLIVLQTTGVYAPPVRACALQFSRLAQVGKASRC